MSILTQFLPKKDSKNYFIVLGLEEHHVRAAVAEITGDKVKILGTGKSEFAEEEKETEAVDIAVSMAEKQANDKLLVENVIFALPQLYLDGINVKPQYLARLKKIANELHLKAYGFVEYATAVSNYLQTSEGSPPTVLIMDLSKNHITVTLVRVGKIQQNVTVERTDSLVTDFAQTLLQFEAEILPPRIVIFDFSEKKEDIREELLKFPWHKHSIFMHTPKMEIFDNEKIMTAIVEAAATSFLPNIILTDEKTSTEIGTFEKPEKSREKFVTEEVTEEVTEGTQEESEAGQQPSFGFSHESLTEKAQTLKKETGSKQAKTNLPINGIKDKIFNLIKVINPDKINVNLSKFSFNIHFRGIFLLIPVFIAVILIFILIRAYPTATVSIYTYPVKSDQTKEIVFVKEGSDIGNASNVIATRTITTEVEGSKTGKTTGTNQIGERAKGEVTLYNKSLSSKNLPKGTELTSGPLKFTLDNEVKIASASETGEGITFGKTSIKVTAGAIGPESNLPASANFTVKDFSESTLTAKNNQPFSGGTAREIDSISKEDRNNLDEILTNDLKNTAKQKLSKELSPRGRLLEEPLTTIISAKKFSGEANQEAKELTLTMTLKVEALEYNQEDLDKLSLNQTSSVPSGYKLDPDKMNVKVKDTKLDKNGNINATVILSSYFIPDFDLNKIKNEIKGKTYNETQEALEKTNLVAGMKITPDRKLPFTSKRLPIWDKNINLVVVSK